MLPGAAPAPGNEILVTGIIRPAGSLTELPLTIPHPLQGSGFQKRTVESHEVRVDRLDRTASEEDRKPDLPSLELSFMKEFCPRNRGNGHGGGALPLGRKDRTGTGFVVVFDETDQLPLVAEVGAKMEPHVLRGIAFQTVVQA